MRPAPAVLALLAAAGLWSCTGGAVEEGSDPGRRPERPNVIIVVTDDQRPESLLDMPAVQQHIAGRALSFERAFTSSPICCPARASILRGQYPHNHGTLKASGPGGGFYNFHTQGREESTLATWLDAAGYDTFFAGKYLNGYTGITGRTLGFGETYVPPGWNRWFGSLAPIDYFDYKLNENGTVVRYGSGPEEYLTDVIADRVVEFVDSTAAGSRPFFMYIAPFAPHGAHLASEPTPAPRHAGAFADRRVRRTPSFNEADVDDKGPWVGLRPLLDESQLAAVDELHRQRLRSLLAVDELVDRLFAALAGAGREADTYVFFTTDNGFHLGEHRMASGKGFPWEEDLRVPLLLVGPGVESGSRDEMVLLSDLAPTIAELAGVTAPEYVDGRSLVPLLAGTDRAVDWRRAFGIERSTHAEGHDSRLIWRGVRTETHKLVEWVVTAPPAPGRPPFVRELYDLEADPFELENRLGDADSDLEARLIEWAESLATCAAAECRAIEETPPR